MSILKTLLILTVYSHVDLYIFKFKYLMSLTSFLAINVSFENIPTSYFFKSIKVFIKCVSIYINTFITVIKLHQSFYNYFSNITAVQYFILF